MSAAAAVCCAGTRMSMPSTCVYHEAASGQTGERQSRRAVIVRGQIVRGQGYAVAVRAAGRAGAVRAAQKYIGQVGYGWISGVIGGIADFPNVFKFRTRRAPRGGTKSQYRAFRKKRQIENVCCEHRLASCYSHKNTPSYFYTKQIKYFLRCLTFIYILTDKLELSISV
jgi:hypothetical protein